MNAGQQSIAVCHPEKADSIISFRITDFQIGDSVSVTVINAGKWPKIRQVLYTDRLPIVNAIQVNIRCLYGIEVSLSAVHIVSKTLEVVGIADNSVYFTVEGHGGQFAFRPGHVGSRNPHFNAGFAHGDGISVHRVGSVGIGCGEGAGVFLAIHGDLYRARGGICILRDKQGGVAGVRSICRHPRFQRTNRPGGANQFIYRTITHIETSFYNHPFQPYIRQNAVRQPQSECDVELNFAHQVVKYEDNGIIAAGNTFGIIAIEDVERKLFFDGGLVARVQVEDIIIVGGTTGMPGDDVHRCVSRVIHRRAIGRGQCSVLRVYVVKHVGTAGDEVVGQRAAGGEHEDAHCVALCPCGIAIGVEGCAGGR